MSVTIIVGLILYVLAGMALATIAYIYGGEPGSDATETVYALMFVILWPLLLVMAIPVGVGKAIRNRRKPAPWTSELD